MKRLLKRMGTVLLAGALLVSAVACSKTPAVTSSAAADSTASSAVTDETTAKVTTGEPITLTVWLPANNENENVALSKMMDAYNDLNKGKVVVEYEFVPRANSFAYEDKISAAVTIDQLPDVLMMDGPNVSNYANGEIIKPIGEYFTEEELADFVDSVVDQGTYNNELYALAPTESNVAVYYNKDITDAAGIVVPDKIEDAWTFDEFLTAVKAAHNPGVVNGLNICPDYGTGEWMTYMPTFFVWANGGDIVSKDGMKADGYINSPATVEAMTYFQSLAAYADWQATPTEFEEGRAAFKISGSWCVPGFEANYPDLNWGITYLPYSTVKASPCGDWAFGVSSKTHAKESTDFLKFMLSAENIATFSEVAGKPAGNETALNESELWNTYPRSIIKDQVINTGHPRPKTPAYPVLTQEFASAAVDIFLGADVQERLDQAAQNIDENIAKNFE